MFTTDAPSVPQSSTSFASSSVPVSLSRVCLGEPVNDPANERSNERTNERTYVLTNDQVRVRLVRPKRELIEPFPRRSSQELFAVAATALIDTPIHRSAQGMVTEETQKKEGVLLGVGGIRDPGSGEGLGGWGGGANREIRYSAVRLIQ